MGRPNTRQSVNHLACSTAFYRAKIKAREKTRIQRECSLLADW